LQKKWRVASGRRVTESSAAEAGFCEYLNVGARSSDPLKKRKSKKKSKKEEKKRKKEKRENREKGKRRTDPSFAQTTQRMGHPQVLLWSGKAHGQDGCTTVMVAQIGEAVVGAERNPRSHMQHRHVGHPEERRKEVVRIQFVGAAAGLPPGVCVAA
jgi:hypothetical protein